MSPVLSRDGLTIWFASQRAGGLGGFDIWVSTRSSHGGTWSQPTRATPLCSEEEDWPNGVVESERMMVFTSSRGGGAYHLWMATREARGDVWSSIKRLDELDNVSSGALSDDGLRLYFRGLDDDIHFANRDSIDDRFVDRGAIAALSSERGDYHLFITGDERTLVFASDRITEDSPDLFMATLQDP
jgi:hypothetical protein